MNNVKKANPAWGKIIIVLAVLFVPSVSYFLLTRGTNNFKHLEIYGPKDVDAKGDTIFHTIPDFSFTNQERKTITQKDLNGRIYIASFFYATCPRECPKMNENLRIVQSHYKDLEEVRMVSYSINPEHDSVPVLAAYAKQYGADPKQWWFLTGKKEEINSLAENGYLVPAAQGKGPGDFFHSQQLLLIDKEKRIRGIYDGLDAASVDSLVDDVKALMHEYVEKKKK